MDIDSSTISYFQESLLAWFESNGRTFPWRNRSASNYVRIISEVLLQRTKAEAVANYFPIFIKSYPSWRQLGNASKSELENILKPLGLQKQRADRLFKLAQELKKRNGRFPSKRSEVEEMPMMGQYITNAFELFILNKPSPLLDVNMARVIERFFGPRQKADIRYDDYLQTLSKAIISHESSIELNWAILDIGGLVCTKRNPKCQSCPVSNPCKYFKEGKRI